MLSYYPDSLDVSNATQVELFVNSKFDNWYEVNFENERPFIVYTKDGPTRQVFLDTIPRLSPDPVSRIEQWRRDFELETPVTSAIEQFEEEVREFIEAYRDGNPGEIRKEAVDVMFTLVQIAETLNIDLVSDTNLVLENNYSKVWTDEELSQAPEGAIVNVKAFGNLVFLNGKLIKPPSFKKLDLNK